MIRPRSVVLLLALALLLVPSVTGAVRAPDPHPLGETAAGSRGAAIHPDRQAALSQDPAWRAFQARRGDWRALWNERTGTPHLAFGPPVPLEGSASGPAQVDGAVRAFVAAHPDLFGGSPDLETVRAIRVGRIWYVSYRRRVVGVPVLFEDWEFRVSADGGLMAFGADAHPAPSGPSPTPLVDAAGARAAARSDLGVPDAAIEGGDALHWLPVEVGRQTALRLVREVRARTSDPPGNWILLVDAESGAVLWRHDRMRHDVSGTVTGSVHLDLPTSTPAARPFARQRVTVGGNAVVTDAAGSYTSPATGTVTVAAALSGPFCDVNRHDAADAAFSVQVADPAVVPVSWDDANSHPAERDAFFHLDLAHDHVKTLDPGFTGNDYAMPCRVNYSSTCNAAWDGTGVIFYQAGSGCPNTATMPDVVYHEYGHGVNDNLYLQAGASFGMLNGTLHEGLADVLAAFIQDTPSMGKGFFGPGTVLRELDNTRRWPDDASGDPHLTGLILGGALWDLRQAVGLPLAERLSHFAKYGRPDDFDDGTAMGEFFVQTLVADDDDGNLSNGTPHSDAIIAAFNAHGIGTGLFLLVWHSPLDDQPGERPYPMYATVQYQGPIGGVDQVQVHYSVNGVPFPSITMTPIGFDEYTASLPAPRATIVRYHITASDQHGQTRSHPPNPAAKTHVFLAGATATYLIHDHESDAGWVRGGPSDDATTGLWVWVEPQGSFVGSIPVQPEDDHTSNGIFCWVTANPFIDTSPGAHDVDGGRTTLTTSTFDAAAAGPNPLIEYFRWYTNHLGANPGTDVWTVQISNDGGGSWTTVESTSASDNSWRREVFFARDYVTPTDLMRLRFVAQDADPPSLVEAAVDDLRLLRFEDAVTGAPAAGEPAPALALAAPAPNPGAGRTRRAFTLAAHGPAELAIYDVAGRRVRTLLAGTLGAGPHQVTWDGRDEGGGPAGSGLYFARLAAEGRELVRRLVRTR